jgi:hypothetical protein
MARVVFCQLACHLLCWVGRYYFALAMMDIMYFDILTRSSCRFSYGSYLIWFNVLNGTASIILGSPPYSFRYVCSDLFC